MGENEDLSDEAAFVVGSEHHSSAGPFAPPTARMEPAGQTLDFEPAMKLQDKIARLATAHALGMAIYLVSGSTQAGDAGVTGAEIYQRKCASCHGASGEGSPDHYPRLLAGDRSAAALARLIAKTMPEDAPGECVGADAEKVAAYIHESFYSRTAQARLKGELPRIELARLTVRQYREVAADLIGSFRESNKPDEGRGLAAVYGRRGGGRRRAKGKDDSIDRVDREVRFDFGPLSPIPAQRELFEVSKRWATAPVLFVPLSSFRGFSQDFDATWKGSVEAVETGEYEFVIHTENAARLWVNDQSRALIDAGVKSGDQTDYRASIRLLGGRRYPLRLEFFRSREKSASISLLWKPPGGALEVIPARRLSLTRPPETFVLSTPFPPDDRSMGYERGTSISKAWDQATTEAAIEIADFTASHLKELAEAPESGPDREVKVRTFCERFAERAFRRPLTPEQKALFVTRRFQGARELETAVKQVVLLVLKSPRFLYREAGSPVPDGYDAASRLSFGLWDSLPDAVLLAEAAAGRLKTREQIAAQAERMVKDPRARAKLRLFLLRWLKVDQPPEIAKDPKLFPGFDEAVVADLRTSLVLFLDDVIASPEADFRRLLNSDRVYLNGRLSRIYGGGLGSDASFEPVVIDPQKRSGVLSHPYLMSSFAYTATTSPIHRGVFLARGLLGRVLMPPPEAVAPLAPDLHPSLTTRERVTLQTKPQACVTCHGMINPLGFALEHFDAIGRYRQDEKGKPINAQGRYETRSGETATFDGVPGLAAFLSRGEETRLAFVSQLFHALVQQPIRAFGPETPAVLAHSFASREFNITRLVVEIMATSALTPRGPRA